MSAKSQKTHKSQPNDLLLRVGAISVGGAADIQQPTAAPLSGSYTATRTDSFGGGDGCDNSTNEKGE